MTRNAVSSSGKSIPSVEPRGVVLPILEHRPAKLVIANRTVSKAEELVEQFAALGGEGVVAACGFDGIESEYDIIINGTAASLSAELPPISPSRPSLAATPCRQRQWIGRATRLTIAQQKT